MRSNPVTGWRGRVIQTLTTRPSGPGKEIMINKHVCILLLRTLTAHGIIVGPINERICKLWRRKCCRHLSLCIETLPQIYMIFWHKYGNPSWYQLPPSLSSLSSQAMVCISAGCCLAIGLRYAGTLDKQAHSVLVRIWQLVISFSRHTPLSISHCFRV